MSVGRDVEIDVNVILEGSVQLGDEVVKVRTVVLWPGGELRDGYVLEWRHDSVVLSVTVVEPVNGPAPAYLDSAAQALDAAYSTAPPLKLAARCLALACS